jgi:aryl-alcohol dehydrogenase-like predicted oxidoreductase
MAGIQVIYGAGSAGSWGSEVDGPKVLDALEEMGISKIDTARVYGPSEELLGQRGAAARIAIDTKHPGGFAKETRATKENVLEVAKRSFELLKTDQVMPHFILISLMPSIVC